MASRTGCRAASPAGCGRRRPRRWCTTRRHKGGKKHILLHLENLLRRGLGERPGVLHRQSQPRDLEELLVVLPVAKGHHALQWHPEVRAELSEARALGRRGRQELDEEGVRAAGEVVELAPREPAVGLGDESGGVLGQDEHLRRGSAQHVRLEVDHPRLRPAGELGVPGHESLVLVAAGVGEDLAGLAVVVLQHQSAVLGERHEAPRRLGREDVREDPGQPRGAGGAGGGDVAQGAVVADDRRLLPAQLPEVVQHRRGAAAGGDGDQYAGSPQLPQDLRR